MKTKLLICAVLLLGAAGTLGTSLLHTQSGTFKVAERMET